MRRSSPSRALRAAAGAMLALSPAVPLYAQTGKPAVPDSVWATPRGRYDAGSLHRLLLSSGYRDLWATPVRVEVLDLGRFGGGLTPDGLGGGQQTRSLRFRGADGRRYAFRSIDKDASRTLDPELRRSIAAGVLQDQVGSLLPLSALVVSPLVKAAGVLQSAPQLFIMPDDARLGEHRAEFAGMLGFVEERPNEAQEPGEPGFEDAVRVTGSEAFFDRLEDSSSNRLDDAAYLRARLIDILVGDWDRHPDQWRWAAFEEGPITVWRPIPRDRDWALARMDGLIVGLIPLHFPQYVGFGRDYPSAFRLTWSGRALDRRLLSGTPRATWDTVVADLGRRLTDDVIDDAVRRLPPPYYERIGARLTADLLQRRDELPEMADEFYRLLAGWVDVHSTDEDEVIELVRLDSGQLRVEISSAEASARKVPQPFFRRIFDARETREVRLYLHGGDDRVTVTGAGDGPAIRVIGGGGDDTLTDRTRGRDVYLYDARGDNRFEPAARTVVDRRDYEQPIDSSSATSAAPARDWGSAWYPIPVVSYDADFGLVVGARVVRYGYRFRHYPHHDRLALAAGFGTAAARPWVEVEYDRPLAARIWRTVLHARWSGAEVDRFFGLGNGTTSDRDPSFYRARRAETRLSAQAAARPGHLEISVGPEFRSLRPFDVEGTLLDSVAPYGSGDFDQLAAVGTLLWDRREGAGINMRGGYIMLRSRFVPAVLSVDETFGGVSGDAAAYLRANGLPTRPTLALRAGGEKLWGTVPYFEAAYLGGRGTLRGFHDHRFAGDASLFANSELRLHIFRHQLLFPGSGGVHALADVGRVFLDGEASDRWHSAFGGGLWLSFGGTGRTGTLTVARSSERTALYLGAGFNF